MLPDVGLGEVLVIAIVLFALFGYRRLPDAARSLGRSLRVFRAETRGLSDDDVRAKAAAPSAHGPLGQPSGQAGPEPVRPEPARAEQARPEPVRPEPPGGPTRATG